MHPLYKNPEYVAAIKKHDESRAEIKRLNNVVYLTWKKIQEIEDEYYSHVCSSYEEDPAICDDMGEPKGQCVHCGYKWFDHNKR
jgi:hypothetical protein